VLLEQNWTEPRFQLFTRQHFYHVGSTEDLRHAMTEALVTNLSGTRAAAGRPESEQLAFFEKPSVEFGSDGKRAAR
jgi:DNA adenine methylase